MFSTYNERKHMISFEYDHIFVDHLDQPVRLPNGETHRVLETQVVLSDDTHEGQGTVSITFVHRVVAL